MSHQNVSAHQLAMFMTPREISSQARMGDLRTGQQKRHLMASKTRENKKSGLDESVKQFGVQKPLNIYHEDGNMRVDDGHHRLAAAMRHHPDSLIPVQHTDAKEGWWTLPADHDSDWAIRKNVDEKYWK